MLVFAIDVIETQPLAYVKASHVTQTALPSAAAASEELYYSGMYEILGRVTSDDPQVPMLLEIPSFLVEAATA
jgi:hypothetical protein